MPPVPVTVAEMLAMDVVKALLLVPIPPPEFRFRVPPVRLVPLLVTMLPLGADRVMTPVGPALTVPTVRSPAVATRVTVPVPVTELAIRPALLLAPTLPLALRVAAVRVPVLLTVRPLPEPVRLASMVPTVVLRTVLPPLEPLAKVSEPAVIDSDRGVLPASTTSVAPFSVSAPVPMLIPASGRVSTPPDWSSRLPLVMDRPALASRLPAVRM